MPGDLRRDTRRYNKEGGKEETGNGPRKGEDGVLQVNKLVLGKLPRIGNSIRLIIPGVCTFLSAMGNKLCSFGSPGHGLLSKPPGQLVV